MSVDVKTNVIKRNGEEVDFNSQKIINAVHKANEEVDRLHQMNDYQIIAIADNIANKVNESTHAVNVEDIQAYIVGEHGDSQVAVFSSATVGGFPLEEYASQTGVVLDKEELAEHTKNGGAEIIGLKGATFYGVAMAVSTIVETIMKDDSAILPVAHRLDDSFGAWAGAVVSLITGY